MRAFTITARAMRWDLRRVFVPVGVEVSARVENRDVGIPHNLHVRLATDPRTELVVGVATQELRFVVSEAGEFEFLCDIHPFMSGVVVAVART
ncbi:MAG: cupredoxin domain-containing protein [Acidimicrobiales bacterium]